MAGSELNSLLLSGGADGKTCIYDLNRRLLVNHLQYSSSVTCLKWLPLEVILESKYVYHLGKYSYFMSVYILKWNYLFMLQ